MPVVHRQAARYPDAMLEHDEVVRLYSLWRRRTPSDAASLLSSYTARWWIAGGWAIDAFTGSERVHGDLYIGIPREEVEDFISYVSSALDVWAAAGSLTPLLPHQHRGVPVECGNLWLRKSRAAPWEYDVLLEEVRGATWHYKRDPALTKPLDKCLWERAGIRYLKPEIQLLLKAKHARDKDTHDLRCCLQYLDAEDAAWLEEPLREYYPDHKWLKIISGYASK